MGTPSYLTTSALSRTLDETKVSFGFLKNLLFSRRINLSGEDIELSSYVRDRKVAPFVRRGGAAAMTEGYQKKFASVAAPYIRIKRPLNPWEGMNERLPGMGIFPSEGERRAANRAHVARELRGMEDDIVNREEWMCAMALRGVIEYQVEDGETFEITFPKPSGHTTTAAASWGTSTTDPSADFKAAKRLMATAHSVRLPVTHAIFSPEAADKFMALSAVKTQLDQRNFDAGALTIQEQFSEDGTLMYLGRYAGVPCWEYSASLDGTQLIRANYVEFVSATPRAENKLFYGAIADEDAPDGLFVGRRFGKSWVEKDPSARILLAASRPLPVMERAGSVVSIDVT